MRHSLSQQRPVARAGRSVITGQYAVPHLRRYALLRTPEIKDALSYLRLIANRNDDAAFERVVNTPTRGIGDRTLDVVRQTSRDRQLTLWQVCRELLQEKATAGRAASALQRFMELIDALAQETADMPLHVQTDRVIKDSGLRTMYEQEKGEKGQTRIENLEELVTATRQFSYNDEDEDLMPLQAFLSHAALEAGEGQADTAGCGTADDAALGQRPGVSAGVYRRDGRGDVPQPDVAG